MFIIVPKWFSNRCFPRIDSVTSFQIFDANFLTMNHIVGRIRYIRIYELMSSIHLAKTNNQSKHYSL